MCKTYVQKMCEERGLKLTDATRPIVVGVAVDDILKSRTKNSKCCAFARAAKREPGVRAAYFFRSTAFLEFGDRMVRYSLPQSVQKEIVSFDRGGIMAPGEYELRPPRQDRESSARPARQARTVLDRISASLPMVINGRRAVAPPPSKTGRKQRPTPFIRTLDEPR